MSFGWDGVFEKNAERVIKKTFPADMSEVEDVLSFFSEVSESGCADERVIDKLMVIAEEIFVNIASYAYDGSGNADISLLLTDAPPCLHILFADKGKPFNPLLRTEEEAAESVVSLTPGGLGIIMVKKMSDKLEYRYLDGENQLYIAKLLKS